jgi:perosamine synthetase
MEAKQKIIQVAQPYYDDKECKAVEEVIKSGWVTQGPKVAEFEQAFAKKHGVKHGIATSSCTTALHLALLAIGIGPGDAVIVPSFTWVATANAVEYCGATPIFCDIDPQTYNIDPISVRKVLKSSMQQGFNVRAIIAVHLFGLCAEMDEIMALANEYGLRVVEDAACAAGSSYKGQPAGSIGDIGCFSFHPRKILVTGEGGMCTTNDDELAAKISCFRNHGASVSEKQRHYGNAPYLLPEFKVLGYNYRMTDLQGTLGLIQLERLERFISERDYWARYYDQELAKLGWLRTPARPEGYTISWQAYVCMVGEKKAPLSRNRLMEYLQRNRISTRPGTHAVHMLGYYQNKYGLRDDDFPVAKDAYEHSIALPLHNCMQAEDYEYIVSVLRRL